jgi:hypothetical protein
MVLPLAGTSALAAEMDRHAGRVHHVGDAKLMALWA